MRTIQSSLQRFKQVNPLSKRQSGGACSKREAQSLTLKALHLRADRGDGKGQYRIGFESVFDAGIERKRLYCLTCGTLAKDTDDVCRICKANFRADSTISLYLEANGKALPPALSDDKFGISCQNCNLPFHSKDKITSAEQDFKDAVGFRSDICMCCIEARQKRAENLRRDRVNRKIAEQNKRKARKSAKLTALKIELDNILSLDKTGLSRAEKRELSQRKVYLMRQLDL